MGLAEDLAALGDLFERGVIDRQHFEEAKARLLGEGGEVPAEGVASEGEGSLLPTPLPPDDAETLGSSPPPRSQNVAQQAESDEDDVEDAKSTLMELFQQNALLVALITLGVLLLVVWLTFTLDTDSSETASASTSSQEYDPTDLDGPYWDEVYACADDLYWGIAEMVDHSGSNRAQASLIDRFGNQSWEHRWVLDNYYVVLYEHNLLGLDAAIELTHTMTFDACVDRMPVS